MRDSRAKRVANVKSAALVCVLIERLAQGDIALLLLGPVATAGDGSVNHEVVAVDERGFVAGEKHCGVRDVVRQAGTWNWLGGLVNLAHHAGGLLGRIG